MAMMAMLGYAVGAWLPDRHGAHVRRCAGARSDMVLGLSTIFINTIGIFVAGRICDYWATRGHTDAPIRVCLGIAVAVAQRPARCPLSCRR